jgi:hypothetical protein
MPTPGEMPARAGAMGAHTGPNVAVHAERHEGPPGDMPGVVTFRTQIDDNAPGERNNVKHESLGTQMIEGVSADGTRTTMTIPAGAIGNEQPINIVTERWFSSQLKTAVMTKTSDPRMGETDYKLSNVKLVEPDPGLFTVPADYTVQ